MRSALGLAVLLAVTAGIYAPTLGYGLVYEDRNDLETFYRPMVWGDVLAKPARSLTVASFALTHRITVQPWADHAGNVALHLVNGLLLCLVIGAGWPALFGVGVFLLHPIQVESVAYVSSRSELVSTAAVLLALLATSRGWGVAALLAGALAVAGKETAIVAAGLVPLWAWWTQKPLSTWLVAVWLIGSVIGIGYFVARYPLQMDLWQMGGVMAQFWSLLALVLVPISLTIDHDWQFSMLARIAAAASLLIVPLLVRTRAAWSFALLWCLICISPRLLVPLDEGLHEHHFYLPLVGVCLCLGTLTNTAQGVEHG